MSIQVDVQDVKTGTVKTLNGSYALRSMTADALFYHANATEITTFPYTLSLTNEECIIAAPRTVFTLEYSADSGAANGQGITLLGRAVTSDVEITDAKSEVYVIRAKYISAADEKPDIFLNSNREAATSGMRLYEGDAILSDNKGGFIIQYTMSTNYNGYSAKFPYVAFQATR